MKKFLQIGLIAVLFLTANGVYAKDGDFTLKVKDDKEKSIRFSFEGNEDVNLSIIGNNNEVLFQENIQAKTATSKLYDLNALPDGKYTVRIESDTKLANYKVGIYNGKATVSEPVFSDLFHPLIKKEGDFIVLKVENEEGNPIEVQVMNEYNDNVYTEVFKNKSVLQRKFNISKTDSESLTFVINVKGKQFSKTIELY
ncbi:hypothetical protein EV200_101334 [Pedobacter psychrotolerans]|uniref:Secreted protein (Por secretion system target) n=1 Tax=Pedobacter psychrotolerans TaxID=1843235 RepID=A0A4R2HMC1_9SPHI|nr:hypothetical protein [Pedobacter psychrotolerans]TCO30895.1 hypothetical protein EV200_101334 [Pedobacter psychrotolerans]GGE43706.1 hypothetical protein GCM10011413_07150 [Pedobacter psychrotolerans]